jgi:hypothetical protein
MTTVLDFRAKHVGQALVPHTYNPSYSGGRDQFVRPYLQNPYHEKGLVEWLKVKALSSNSSTSKKKERKEEEEEKKDRHL